MQTGEYRGFVGQFSVWLRGQIAIWRAPLLLSLGLHAVLFWPKSMQENSFGVTLAPATGALQARLKPIASDLAEAPSIQAAPVRHASVTQSSPASAGSPLSSSPAVPAVPAELPGLSLQPTAGLDAGAVRAYRIAWARMLANAGLREKLGLDMHGVLEVGVAVSSSGQVRDIAVLKGSGNAALDATVIAVMRTAVPTVGVPATLSGREFVLTVPVEVGETPVISAAGR